MRLLIDARSLVDPRAGGVTRVSRGLLEAFLTSTTDEVVLVTTGSNAPDLNALVSPRVRHLHLRFPNKLWSLMTILGITSLDRAAERYVGKIDTVILPNLGFVGALRRPYVLLLHDLSFVIEARWFSFKARWWHTAVHATRLITHATQLLAVSETTKRDTMRLFATPSDKISVIEMGSSLSVLATDSPSPISGRYVIALGWDDPRKNARTAVRAIEILNQDPAFADVKCIVLGRDIARPTDTELAALYKHAAAFLYPSWYEGYGFPLWEAASFGTPCIASTAGSLPETAPPGTRFVDPAKPHQWAQAIHSVLSIPQTRHETSSDDIRENKKNWTNAANALSEAISRCH